jgi:intermediate peptidase
MSFLVAMIGRTEYHNVSGTRCATDFVELPSILMEHFVSSPSVLSLFAKHYQTGATIPLPLIQSHLSIQQSLSSLETHGQILMAILDQKYHSISPTSATSIESDFSTQMYNELQSEIGVIPPVEGTAWQTQFGHLYGYGSTYYSYLFDRAISGKIWNELFVNDPLERAGGDVFKEGVLKWGGGKDPWQLIGSVLKDPREAEIVSRGDEKSMDMVGSWLLK